MNFHATVNGQAALFCTDNDEIAILPKNLSRFVERDGEGVVGAIDLLGRAVYLNWNKPLANQRVVVDYAVHEHGSRFYRRFEPRKPAIELPVD